MGFCLVYTFGDMGFSGYSSKAPFDPSMMVHFRKRYSDDDLRRINELVVQRGKEMLVEVIASQPEEEDSDDQDSGNEGQLSICQPTSNTEPAPTPKSEPPPTRSGASFPDWFRLGRAGGASVCSWFAWLVAFVVVCH
jgi:hypothetical protein